MGALLDAVPAGGADHTEHHRDLATAIEAVPDAYQPLDSDLTAIAALTTTAYGRSLLTLANQAALQSEAGGGGGALTPGVDYPTSATVTLSSAQILDLHNTPVTLVAAPGAGKMLMPHRVLCQYSYGTAAYVNGDGAPRLTLDNGQASVTLGGLIDQATDYWKTFAIDFDTANDPTSSALIVDDGGAAHTDGDGTLTVTCWYTIEDVPA